MKLKLAKGVLLFLIFARAFNLITPPSDDWYVAGLLIFGAMVFRETVIGYLDE